MLMTSHVFGDSKFGSVSDGFDEEFFFPFIFPVVNPPSVESNQLFFGGVREAKIPCSLPGGYFGEPTWDVLLQGHETGRWGGADLGPRRHALHQDWLFCRGPAKLRHKFFKPCPRGEGS